MTDYREIFEKIPDGVTLHDPTDGTILDSNQKFCDLLGYTREELLSLDFAAIHADEPPYTSDRAEEYIRKASTEGPQTFEWLDKTKEGDRLPVEVNLGQTTIDGDERILAVVRDISERKEQEQELRDASRRLNLALEATDTGVWEWDLETDEVVWSETLERLLGIEPGNFDGTFEAHEAYLHPEARPVVERAIEEALEGGGTFDAEFRMVREDGEVIWVKGQGKVYTEDGGQRLIGTTTDVSERKEHEAELERKQSETARLQERLAIGLAATDTYVWEWDLETDEIERYPTERTLFGLAADDIGPVFEGWVERVHPEERDAVEGAITQGIETGDGYQFECRFETDDGTWRWVRDRAEVVTEDGEPVRAIGSVTDVTEQLERERTLLQLVQQLGDLIDTTTAEETCQVAIDIAGNVLEAPMVGIHLVAGAGDRLDAIAVRDEVRDEFGEPPTYDRAADEPASELVWNTFESGESTYIEDTRNHGTLAEVTPARSVIVHPLDDHGVFIMSTTEPDAFAETDRAFTELLAQAVTAVLDRVEREEMLRARNRQLEGLHETGQDIIQADTREAIAEKLVTGAQSILGYSIVMVRYYDEAAGGLVPAAASEAVARAFESRPTFTPDDESLNWSVYESGSPAVFDDVNTIDRAVDPDTPIRSLMVIPIGEQGTVSIGSTTPSSFDESDVSLAQLLVTTGELALSNLDREQELIDQRDELSRQNARLDEFASVVSHDLRNPLNVANGRLELAMEDGDNDHLEDVARAHDRMETLIDDMLSLANAGEAVGETEPVDLPALAEACWRNVETASATIAIETDANLRADGTRLQQLLENLLRNAVEHGGDAVRVTVGDLPDGFYVEDDGPGIPPDERGDIFTPGYSGRSQGTGFGLNIVRDIAQAHGWEVDLSESADGGARFEFAGVDRE